MKETKITCFENFSKVSDPKHQNLESILNRFKEDKNDIEGMRKKTNFKELKRSLPIACFGGVFNHRSKEGLIKSSQLLTLDFDDVTNLEEKRKEITDKPYTLACFISPSGNGLKALIKIPQCKTDKEYKEYYNGIRTIFDKIDESGKDISRACFFAYDPNIYINYNCETFTKKLEDKTNIPKLNKGQIKNDYHLASRILNIIRNAVPGERHNKILNASRLMGGYVASEKISQHEAMRLLEQECYHIAPDTPIENLQTITDGLENGLLAPLNDFIELEKEESEMRLGKIYFTLKDKEQEIEELWTNGRSKGYELSFNNCKDKISFKLGCTSFVYGAPASGKSQLWFEFLVDLSVNHGLKHAIYSPETGNAHEVFIEIMTIYAQKDFFDGSNRMNNEEKENAKKFVDEHFIILDPMDGVFTIEDFWSYIDIVERVYEVKIHTTTADPFNEFAHDFSKDNGRQDTYLERILGANRRNARTNNRHNCLITHVQDQALKESDGISFYPPATARQIAGGQAWFRKGEQMFSVWRPKKGLINPLTGDPYLENESMLMIQKSKPKGIGQVCDISFFYSVSKHSYSEDIGGGTFVYAKRNKEQVEPQEKESMYKFDYPTDWDFS
jgi:hypothetical protein